MVDTTTEGETSFDIPSNIPSLRFEEYTSIGISGNSPGFRTSEQLLEIRLLLENGLFSTMSVLVLSTIKVKGSEYQTKISRY